MGNLAINLQFFILMKRASLEILRKVMPTLKKPFNMVFHSSMSFMECSKLILMS